MTSYELYELYEEMLEELDKIGSYTKEITTILEEIGGFNDKILSSILNVGIGSESTKLITENRSRIISLITNFAQTFDMLKNHAMLISLKDTISHKMKEDRFLKFEEEMKNVDELLKSFDNVTERIYQFVKTKDNSTLVKMFSSMKSCSLKYNNFIDTYNQIGKFVKRMEFEYKEEQYSGYEALEVHFYNKEENYSVYLECFESILSLYNELLAISNVEKIDLKIVKIESGSLYEKVFGEKNVISTLSYILKQSVDFIFRKFTYEGEIARKKDLLNFLNQELDLINRMKESGIEISSSEENVQKCFVVLSGDIIKLAAKSSKIRIDDKVLSINEEFSKKYIEESRKIMIEPPK